MTTIISPILPHLPPLYPPLRYHMGKIKDLALTAARMLPKDNNITIKESLDVYSS